MSKRVLIVTGDGAEVLEVYYPYFRVREEGYEAVIASPKRKTLHTVCHDFVEDWDTYTEKPAHQLPSDTAFADVDPAEFDALIIPGGRAPEFIRNDPDLRASSATSWKPTSRSARSATARRCSSR